MKIKTKNVFLMHVLFLMMLSNILYADGVQGERYSFKMERFEEILDINLEDFSVFYKFLEPYLYPSELDTFRSNLQEEILRFNQNKKNKLNQYIAYDKERKKKVNEKRELSKTLYKFPATERGEFETHQEYELRKKQAEEQIEELRRKFDQTRDEIQKIKKEQDLLPEDMKPDYYNNQDIVIIIESQETIDSLNFILGRFDIEKMQFPIIISEKILKSYNDINKENRKEWHACFCIKADMLYKKFDNVNDAKKFKELYTQGKAFLTIPCKYVFTVSWRKKIVTIPAEKKVNMGKVGALVLNNLVRGRRSNEEIDFENRSIGGVFDKVGNDKNVDYISFSLDGRILVDTDTEAGTKKTDEEKIAEAHNERIEYKTEDEKKVTETPIERIEHKTVKLPGGVELKLVKVKAGSFMMGSGEPKSDYMQHRVTLTKDFWLGRTEVTQAQYEAVMGVNPSHFKKGGDYPVEQVSWHDAMAFCKKLTEQERNAGRLPENCKYTLPTEAQWEYAARGGNKSRGYKYSGSNDLDEVGWHWNNCENKSTQSVMQKKPNELGIYDMSGNMHEWCLDKCEERNSVVMTDTYKDGVINPCCHSGKRCVYRGGSWNGVGFCDPTLRSSSEPQFSRFDRGFRVALVPVK